jgi:hypothetical protein
MAISNRIAHYFFSFGLRLGVGSPFCWRRLNWPIFCDYGTAARSRCVETTERTDVEQTLHIVAKDAVNNILRAPDRTAFMVMRAALHCRTHVVNNFGTSHGSVDGGGVSQITQENFNIAIVHELRRWLTSNEDANAVPFLQ